MLLIWDDTIESLFIEMQDSEEAKQQARKIIENYHKLQASRNENFSQSKQCLIAKEVLP